MFVTFSTCPFDLETSEVFAINVPAVISSPLFTQKIVLVCSLLFSPNVSCLICRFSNIAICNLYLFVSLVSRNSISAEPCTPSDNISTVKYVFTKSIPFIDSIFSPSLNNKC